MSTLDEIIKKAKSIPPLSQTAQNIIGLMGDPDHDSKKVAQIIQCDAALTAKILTVVNSAAFALAEPITTVARAVMYLGDRIIIGIALDFCTQGLMHKPLEGYLGPPDVLWEHNLRTAIAAKAIAAKAKKQANPDLAFTGGILHDIGKSIISDFLKGTADAVVSGIDKGEYKDYLAGEQQKIGTNHCIIGAALALLWKLPQPLPDIIRYHHNPHQAGEEYRAVTYAVHLGDIMAMMGGTGTGSDSMCYHMDERYAEELEIVPGTLELVMSGVEDEFQKTKKLLFGGISQ
ncbi:MAG: HDOD domain-containing protein [Pseudomonadota bacterium]